MNRRAFLAGSASLSLTRWAWGDAPDATIPLWPARAPNGQGPTEAERISETRSVTRVRTPRLLVHQPVTPNGTGVLVIAGGGYAHIELGKESTPAALFLAGLGYTAFELVYRLPAEGWTRVAPFQDAQRAMRLLRSRASSLSINPRRIGVVGFSAGGHLAAMTSVRPAVERYAPVDPMDAASARPDFAGLIYPVISMLPPLNTTHAFREVLRPGAPVEELRSYSPEKLVDAQTPPLFLVHAENDNTSPVENSLEMFRAAKVRHVPAELHVYPQGGHGFGLGRPGSPERTWPDLFAAWMRGLHA